MMVEYESFIEPACVTNIFVFENHSCCHCDHFSSYNRSTYLATLWPCQCLWPSPLLQLNVWFYAQSSSDHPTTTIKLATDSFKKPMHVPLLFCSSRLNFWLKIISLMWRAYVLWSIFWEWWWASWGVEVNYWHSYSQLGGRLMSKMLVKQQQQQLIWMRL